MRQFQHRLRGFTRMIAGSFGSTTRLSVCYHFLDPVNVGQQWRTPEGGTFSPAGWRSHLCPCLSINSRALVCHPHLAHRRRTAIGVGMPVRTPFRGRRNPLIRQIAMALTETAMLKRHFRSRRMTYTLGLHGELRVTTHDITVAVKGFLPAPLVIAFASDLHAGPTTHPEFFSRLFDEVIERQPDVLLLGGDFVCSQAQSVVALVRELSRCAPRLGKFAVLGNHDLWTDDLLIARHLAGAGVKVLVNDNVCRSRRRSTPCRFAGSMIRGQGALTSPGPSGARNLSGSF